MRVAVLIGLVALAGLGVVRFGWLTPGGAAAALVLGAAVLSGGGGVALILLLLFFVTASLLTGLRARGPGASGSGRGAAGPGASGGGEEAGAPAGGWRWRRGRSASQVLANGGVAGAAALLGLAGLLPDAQVAVLAALGAATADTWATEVGTAAGRETRLITTWRRVEPGVSGGVSWPGTLAGLAGALLLGLVGGVLERPADPLRWGWVAGVAGAVGMASDSFLGASLEARMRWLDNDRVNLAGTLAGAVAGWLAAGLVGS